MKDHVLVVNRGTEATVFGPASRGEILEHLRGIGANQSAMDFLWFDNHEPGVRYSVLALIPMPVLTPVG